MFNNIFSAARAPSRCRLIIPRRALGDGVEGVWPASAISKRLEAASDYIQNHGAEHSLKPGSRAT